MDTETLGSKLTAIIGTVAVLTAVVMPQMAAAALLDEFTQTELDTNWEADRYFPTGDVNSVTAFGRDNVAQIGIDAAETQPGTFQRTEGIKTVGAQNFGTEMSVDLYLDPDWETKAVRAGLWVAGDDGDGARNDFAIIEFMNNEPCPEVGCSNQGNIADHEGFRVWDSTIGWSDYLDTNFTYGEWVTLSISLDTTNQEYIYSIGGVDVATSTGGQHFIREVFLNSYNYGSDSFPTLSSDNYNAYWHVGLPFERSLEITKPASDYDVVSGTVDFEAVYIDEDGDDDLAWAVRSGTCNPDKAATVAGNVADKTNDFDWTNGVFTASVDMSTLPDGDYCLAVNPRDDSDEEDLRATRWFTLDNPDTTDPLVTIEAPVDGATVSGMVTVLGTIDEDEAMGNHNVALYDAGVDVNDFDLRLAQNNVPNSSIFTNEEIWTFDSTTFLDGEYQLRFAARDAAGNRDLSNPETGGSSSVHVITITIDNIPDNPEMKADCKKGGWMDFGFKNQGQCVRFVETGKDSR